jgi:DNA-binding Lrp family transcriptional regulator
VAIEANRDKIDEICARLNSNFYVNLIVTTFGRFDILAIVYFPTWEKLLNFVWSDLSATNGVQTVETFLVKDIKKRFYGITTDKPVPVKIDEIDQRIIEKLTENGRYKSQHIAAELGISPPTCLRRLSRLLREKVIEVKAVPNPSEIGYTANAFILLRVKATKMDEVCSKLSSYKDVYLVITLYNGFDIIIGINSTSSEGLYRFRNELLSLDGILHDETIVRAEIKKRYYGGFLE